MRIFPSEYPCDPRVSVVQQKCKCGIAWCSLCCSALPAGIYSLVPGPVQQIFCGLGDVKPSEAQRCPSTALTNIPAKMDKPLNQTFKPGLESGGQVEDTPEPVLLRACIPESHICWCFPAAEHVCPCVTLLEAIQAVTGVSVVTSIHSFGILNPGSEGESSAGCLLRTVPGNPWMGWGRRAEWICSTQ